MSIKDLFNNTGVPKIQKTVSSDEMVEQVESQEYVKAKDAEFEQFVPPIDFSTASNFAKFGSAELYYEKAFERIYQYYPYDGTLAEKAEFHNSSSYLDKYVFDNLYPRTNGYVNFDGSSQYITVFGGPHTASNGMVGKTLDSTFENSMLYDASKRRTSAFEYRVDRGATVEFWLKREASVASEETIFDIWNGEETGSAGYGRIKVELDTSDNLTVTMESGSNGFHDIALISNAVDGDWHHYALTIASSSTGTTIKSFKNSKYIASSVQVGIGDILPQSSGVNAAIGALYTGSLGGNKFSGSMDEFRYWKTERSPEAIFNTWFIPVGGGTNKYDSNIDLGLYFKFNEGITTTTSLDSIALDYSGRINNGTIVGYTSNFRNTGSAITEKLSEPEYLEPIIYSSHPDVSAKKAEYKASGSLADLENSSMLLSYLPGWMQEEDELNGKNLKHLCQVMGSYFDTLWHQISFIDRVHDNQYISGSNKALPFAKELLYNQGFVIPDLFVDASITENLLKKDDNEVYEKQINEVRNTIYHNIYSNLNGIYKTKGTEKSFRNFFRSLGIGQDVVKLRMYADDSTFVLRNNYEHKSFERKYLNFNYEGHFDATLYQTSSTNNANIHLPGDKSFSGSYTLETEIILPRKNRSNETGYLPFNSLTASIMGFHSTGSGYAHPATDNGLSVYVLKESLDANLNVDDSHRVKFMVTGAFGQITSSIYSYQYENNKWNLALRVKHANYPYANVSGNVASDYRLELYGVQADGNTKRNSFLITSSIGADYFTDDKIFYAGAHRTNFTGSSLYDTDIKLGLVRYWHSYLSNAAIDQHAYDSETFGANEPFENDLVNTYSIEIPREKTLALHWAFNDLTSSDSSGKLLVSDLSSGSSDSNYGSLSNTIQRYVQGKAEGFNASAQNALDKTYVQTARKRLPDDLMSSDLTTIKTDETEQFFVDEDVSDNFYSFEKSMWGTISDEMMNMFSTALDLNNLIGQPNQKYHHRYNMADFLRDRFYDDVENEPDIEKFTSFYKWIDDSISIALQQLIPASARFAEKINNVVESHTLERNKYVHQVPILTTFQSTEGSIKGISEMKYDWKHGHAPSFPDEEQTNALWQIERKEKSGLRETLRKSRNNHSVQSSGLTRKEIDGSTRLSDVYAVRRFAKTYDVSMVLQNTIHGGVNFSRQKNLQLFHESIAPGGALSSGTPQNVITVGVGTGDGLVRGTRNDDNLPTKRRYNSNALIGNREGQEYGYQIQGDTVLPMNLMSGTVHSGYNKEVQRLYTNDVIVSNLHHDSVGNHNDTSIQGPFTEAHIGGLQYRHIDVNKYDSSKSVDVVRQTGGTFPTASIQFTASVLSSKLTAGTGSSVTIRDGDGTTVTALYSNVFDLYDNQWTDMDDLVFIIRNKLSVTANKISETFLALTQSVTGNFYNYTIQASAHGFVTASGFGGGSSLTFATTQENLDGPGNRPEGWGLVFKDHPSVGDNDGALGFLGADHGTTYPNPLKLKAARYREETAKRPVNIKNIKTISGSQKAGNYTNEIQLFSVAPEHQKTWSRRAYEDSELDILPLQISEALPLTTNYQTLMGVAPYEKGNIFGGGATGNRQPDTGSLVLVEGVAGVNATGSFKVHGITDITTSDRISIDGESYGIVGSGANYEVATGSSNTEFWNNLTASIEANSQFTASVDRSSGDVYSEALKVTRRDGSFMSSSLPSSEIREGEFTFSAWLKIDGVGSVRRVYREMTTTGFNRSITGPENNGRYISIDNLSSGLLRMNIAYSASTGGFRNDQYYYPGFADEFNGQRVHIVWTHSGSAFNSTTNGHLYINGVKKTLTTSAGGGSGTFTQNVPDDVVFFNELSDGLSTNTLSSVGGGSGDAQIDEIIILSTTASAAAAEQLYNGGMKIEDKVALYSVIPSSSIKQWFTFEGVSVADEATITSLGASPLTLTINNVAASFRTISGSDGAVRTDKARATFSLTSSLQTEADNVAMSEGGSAFFSLLGVSGGVTPIVEVRRRSIDNVITIPRIDLTGSERNINTRFSAPGGPEVQTIGYLDAYSSTYSVHNALPFRNLSVLGSGSGESGTIRVEDHLGLRRGLKTLRGLHMGQFGIDSQYGAVTATAYPSSGSFNKQHRNNSRVVTARDFDASIRFNETTQSYNSLQTNDGAYSSSSFPTTGGKTISFWINFDSLDEAQYIFDGVYSGTTGALKLAYSPSSSKLILFVYDTSNNSKQYHFSWSPDTNRWYNVYIEWSGDFSDNPNAYVNTVSLGTPALAGSGTGSTLKELTRLSIGDAWNTSGIYELKGRLSHLAIYSVSGLGAVGNFYNLGSLASTAMYLSPGNIIDFWLLGNETELQDVRNEGVGASIENGEVVISSIAGNETEIRPTSGESPTIAKGVNYVQTELITKDKYDNAFINSPIPRSELQYSWIHAATTGSDGDGLKYDIAYQKIVGYAPRDGILGKTDQFSEAIVFPSASSIYSV